MYNKKKQSVIDGYNNQVIGMDIKKNIEKNIPNPKILKKYIE